MNPETWAEIRRLRNAEKLPISEIARQLRLDRKTVRAALQKEALPARRYEQRPCKVESFKPYIQQRLKAFARITATRLMRELKAMGYAGGVTQLRAYVATVRDTAPEAFFRLETMPGEQAQVDWANCGVIRIGSALRKLSAFVMVMSYSRMMYVELTLSQCVEDFLQAHVRAFRFFGGIPKKIVYDNLKTVCLARFGTEIRLNPRFTEFSGLFAFEPVLCRPAHGNEKGKVESGIKYLRSSFLDGRLLEDYSKLQDELRQWLLGVANVRSHGTTRRRPVDRFEEERALLQAVPQREVDLSIVRPVKATTQALVHFDGNVYSVPFFCAGKMLIIRASTPEIRVFDKTRPVAKHGRCYDRGKVIENPAHYAGLLEAKKAARAGKSTDTYLAMAGSSEPSRKTLQDYLSGLLHADINIHHHLAKILDLADRYGRFEVIRAVEYALTHKAFGASYLQNIILQNRSRRGDPEQPLLEIPTKPQWSKLTLPERDLSVYDDLFGGQDGKKTTDTP